MWRKGQGTHHTFAYMYTSLLNSAYSSRGILEFDPLVRVGGGGGISIFRASAGTIYKRGH